MYINNPGHITKLAIMPIYEGHSISNAILTIIFCLNTLLKFD